MPREVPPGENSPATRGELRSEIRDVKDDVKAHYLSKGEFYKYVAGVVLVLLLAGVGWVFFSASK